MHTRLTGVILLFATTLSVVSFAGQRPEVSRAPGKLILSADSLISHVRWLSDDAREGRGTGFTGCDVAATWLADQFEDLGLVPGGDDGTYFQEYEATVGVLLGDKNHMTLDGKDLVIDEDYIPFGFSNSGGVENGEFVFVGYGITD